MSGFRFRCLKGKCEYSSTRKEDLDWHDFHHHWPEGAIVHRLDERCNPVCGAGAEGAKYATHRYEKLPRDHRYANWPNQLALVNCPGCMQNREQK